ncbi:zf-TFIIB domain-containing protein [Holophaga foetida]|uniref:zf-TFIIB domain-containing protein n=1 Tax=Holophaga foetida TaxID=35839 RepID=UPI00024717DA|nr:zf-TFIIB domain-containing protein [Holophaga foetida]
MEAAILRCASCGANVGENEVQCPYCRSQLASVACPACFSLVSLRARYCGHCGASVQVLEQPENSDLQCPGCQVKLVNTPIGGVDLHQCQGCGGLWLAKDCFEALSKARATQNLSLPGQSAPSAPLPPHTNAVRYRKCPVCARFMNRVNYARISGVILDSCRDHGLWFDRDELRQVLVFVDGGGLEKARERERLKLEEDLRQKKAAASLPPDQGGILGEPDSGRDLLDLVDTGSLLGRILLGAAGTFWNGLKR